MKDCKYKIEEDEKEGILEIAEHIVKWVRAVGTENLLKHDAKETIGEIIDRWNRRRKPKGENMKKIIIEQCIAIDATPEVFEILADAIVLKAVGYSSPKTYKLSNEPLELTIKESIVEEAKKDEEPIPDKDGAL